MIDVRCEYVNLQTKRGNDYFVFTDIEVCGHATNTGYDNNIKVCAGISAVTGGIARLLNGDQFHIEVRKGYYRVYTNRNHDLKQSLDRDSVYALNTMVCQLYEIYRNNPNAFKSFELIDKGVTNYEEKPNNTNNTCDKRRKGKHRLDLNCLTEDLSNQEN